MEPDQQRGPFDRASLSLTEGMQASGMTLDDLWLRYVAAGGRELYWELSDQVLGLMAVPPSEHDLIAHALNGYFNAHGDGEPVRYCR
ncbi:MAG: hypothetical protein JWN95_114 [Frankiales bacterium]|nr:hypothetical protein [Frankiales bacterium]